jgi:hypothetical protein
LVRKSITKKAPVVKKEEQVVQEEIRKFYDVAQSNDRKEARMGTWCNYFIVDIYGQVNY